VFNLSGTEVIVILLLALVVLGPEKLPDAMRRFGRTYAELKKMGNSFQDEFKAAMDEPMKEMRETADMLRRSTDITAADAPSGPTTDPQADPPAGVAAAPGEPPEIEPVHDDLPFAPSTGDPAIDEHDADAHDADAGIPADVDADGAGVPTDLGEGEARSA
jgi:sec-independent protein translocase protein TatB